MIVIGIDPASTRMAMVASTLDLTEYMAAKADNLSGGKKRSPWSPDACAAAVTLTCQFVEAAWSKWPGCELRAYIEAPVVGKGGVRSTMVQSFTSGAVQGELARLKVPIEMVNVSTWKKAVCERGNATKGDVAAALQLRWSTFHGRAGGDEDLHDAAAIALHGALDLSDRVVEVG